MSAVAYALVNKDDWMMAAMFLGNAVGCAAILSIAAWKRSAAAVEARHCAYEAGHWKCSDFG